MGKITITRKKGEEQVRTTVTKEDNGDETTTVKVGKNGEETTTKKTAKQIADEKEQKELEEIRKDLETLKKELKLVDVYDGWDDEPSKEDLINGINKKGHFLKVSKSKLPEAENLLKDMVKLGIDVNQQDHEGKTALHYAIENQDQVRAKFLVENGADIALSDKRGIAPIDMLKPGEHQEDKEIVDRALKLRALTTEKEEIPEKRTSVSEKDKDLLNSMGIRRDSVQPDKKQGGSNSKKPKGIDPVTDFLKMMAKGAYSAGKYVASGVYRAGAKASNKIKKNMGRAK